MGDLEDDAGSNHPDAQSRSEKILTDAESIVRLMSDEDAASPREVAEFLHLLPHMDPKKVGEVLGEPDALSLSVLQAYANGFAFEGFSLDVALRVYLGRFVLPGEAQKIDRILQAFARAFYRANPRDPTCATEDAVYTLAFALVLLNTDAHSPHLARRFKMNKDDFIRNQRRVVDVHGARVSPQYLAQCYDSFAAHALALIPQKPERMLPDDELELAFGDGPLGLEIETSIDGRTCLVKRYVAHQRATPHWHDATRTSTRAAGPHITGWVVVAVAGDCTRQIGYPLTRYLLRTAARPVVVRFCEPSVFFASLE